MDNPRKLALSSLVKSESSGAYSNLEVSTVLSRAKLSKIDVALYTALYLGVMEKMITLDYQISRRSSIALEKLDVETKNALRLGLYQLIYMDKIPEYSAVSETVNLCPRRSKGFVNACLRSFIRDGKPLALPSDKWQAISVKMSIPVSILDIFRKSYGDEIAEKLALACEPRVGVSLRINTLTADPREIRKNLTAQGISYKHIGFTEEVLNVRAPISAITDILEAGKGFIQDPASFACAKIFNPKKGERVLDACACPGGKSFSSAIEMENEGEIIACDLHKSKLSLVKNGADKLGIKIIKVMEQDAKRERAEFIDSFDKVLCDAPCSGLGVISKKPDIKYKPIEQIQALPEIQLAILENCSKYVKLGAELVYSTWTLNKAENEEVVAKFLERNDGFEALDFTLGDIKSTNGAFTFMPHIYETDGFFVAKMKRVK